MTVDVQESDGELQARHKRLIEDACAQAVPARLPHFARSGRASGSALPGSPAVRGDLDADGPPPDSFTGYQLIREIHRGGQGVVYLALQESTKRKVAIKVMKEGPFASTADRARFEREVQILGQLQHPNIVAIHDTGVAAGHHYFAMDYISGQPLDVYMASGQRGIDETLRLFATICDAVNAAHLRGVIHRDLKPSNIRINGNGEPHILDFGLAKMAAGPSDASMMTMTGAFIGSPPWASPEQAEGILSKIDTRTDVYSLGVILYQMLTGKLPYDVTGNMREVLDRIQKAEPNRPSAIRRGLNDEVDTMVLKCLAKERERRYQTAGELARDIGRYLAGEPLEAKRDSGWYVLRKTLRRHRAATGVMLAFFVLILSSAVTLSLMYRSVLVERDRALDAENAAEQHLAETEAARDESDAVTKFLSDMLAAADPTKLGKDVTVREALEISSEKIGPSFADKPLIQARLQDTIGVTYHELGVNDRAETNLAEAAAIYRRELGETDARTLATTQKLAVALQAGGRYSVSEASLRATLEIQRRVLGKDHPDTLISMNSLANAINQQGRHAEAMELRRTTVEFMRRRFGDEDPHTLGAMGNLAVSLFAEGRYAECEELRRATLEIMRHRLGEEHPNAIRSMHNLADAYYALGRYAEAEALHRKALDGFRRLLGEEHSHTLIAMTNLADVLKAQSRYTEAEALYRKAWETHSRQYGETHPDTLLFMHQLASVLFSEGRYAEAEELFRKTRELQLKSGREKDLQTLTTLTELASLLARQGKPEESQEMYRMAIALRGARAKDSSATAPDLDAYASLLLECEPPSLRDPQASLGAATRAVELTESRNYMMLGTLAKAYQMTGQIDRAIETQRKALALLPPEGSPTRAEFESRLAEFLVEAGSFVEAESLLLDSYKWMGGHAGDARGRINEIIVRMVKLYESWEANDPGRGLADKAAEYRAILNASTGE